MRKRVSGILLCLMAMAFLALWPAEAHAARSYNIWVSDTEVTDASLSGSGWRYDPGTSTLYLTDYTNENQSTYYQHVSGSGYALIYIKGEQNVTIVVEGTCKLGKQGYESGVVGDDGYYAGIMAPDATVTLRGAEPYSGELRMNVFKEGIYAKNLNVISGESGSLYMIIMSYQIAAVRVSYNCTIDATQGAGITLNATTLRGRSDFSYGVYVGRELKVKGRPGNSTHNVKLYAKAFGAAKNYRQNAAIYAESMSYSACSVEAIVAEHEDTWKGHEDDILLSSLVTGYIIIDDAQLKLSRPAWVDMGYRSTLICPRRGASETKVVFRGEGSISNDWTGETYTDCTFEVLASERNDLILWEQYPDAYKRASHVEQVNFIKNDEVSYISGGKGLETLTYATGKKNIVQLDMLRWKEYRPITFNKGVDVTLDLTYGKGKTKTVTGIDLQPFDGGTVRVNADCLLKDLSIKGPGTVYLNQGTSTGTLDAGANLVITGGSHNLNWTGETVGTAKNKDGETVQKYVYQFSESVEVQSVRLRGSDGYYSAVGLYPDEENKIYLWLTDPDQLWYVQGVDSATGVTHNYYVKAGGPSEDVYTLVPDRAVELNSMDTAWFIPDHIKSITLHAFETELNATQLQDYRMVWETNEKDGVLTSRWYDCSDSGKYDKATYQVPENVIREGLRYRCVITRTVNGRTQNMGAFEVVFKSFTPQITKQPEDYILEEPGVADFGVQVEVPEGVKVSYQWEVKTWDGVVFTDLDSHHGFFKVDGPSYGTWMGYSDSGDQYRCRITVSFADTELTTFWSDSASVVLPFLKTQPRDVEYDAEAAGDCSFTVEAKRPEDVISYQWQCSTDGGKTYRDLADGTAATYVVPTPTEDMNGYLYRCKVVFKIHSTLNRIIFSDAAKLNCQHAPVLSPMQDRTVKSGGSLTLYPTKDNVTDWGTPRATLYEIQISTDGGKTFRRAKYGVAADGSLIVFEGRNPDGTISSIPFIISNITLDMDGYQYRFGLGNVYGGKEHMAWTDPMTLHVTRDCQVDGHDWKEATCTEPKTCKVCEATEGDALGHTYETVWNSDETSHWHECSVCKDKGDEAVHEDADRDHACDICGKVFTECADTDHDHNCDTCGKQLTDHQGGTATCTDKAVCAICGQAYGETDPDNHTEAPVWRQTETEHEETWPCCDAVKTATGAHTFENGVCTVCGYGCTHTGGTATCIDQKICDLCGLPYGEFAEHTYQTEWSTDESTHWHECSVCGDKKDEAAHEDADQDHNCDACGKVLSECADTDHDHDCDLCGKKLTECADDNHDHNCDLCGKKLTDHTGGTATCLEKAVCDICGQTYGERNADNHASLTHMAAKESTAATEGNTEYWYCGGCDRYFSDEAATREIQKADTIVAKLPPKMISGDGAKVTRGQKKALTFATDASAADFIRAELDGQILDEANYTREAGSASITLNADYVATLPKGEHTISIVAQSGTATAKFTVKAKSGSGSGGSGSSSSQSAAAKPTDAKLTGTKLGGSPKTGDTSHPALWFLLLSVSGGAAIGTVVNRRKKYNR